MYLVRAHDLIVYDMVTPALNVKINLNAVNVLVRIALSNAILQNGMHSLLRKSGYKFVYKKEIK